MLRYKPVASKVESHTVSYSSYVFHGTSTSHSPELYASLKTNACQPSVARARNCSADELEDSRIVIEVVFEVVPS